jgi:putative FmdB family regulatory protein
MPVYEYECTKCNRITEAWQKFSDKPLETCRHCSGKLHRIISQSTFHLKGTGWYATDYANKSGWSPATKSKEKKSDPATGSSQSKNTEEA